MHLYQPHTFRRQFDTNMAGEKIHTDENITRSLDLN